MSFNAHIDMIVEKALKKFSTLKILCKRVNGMTFLRLYITYILPILEFSNLSVVLTQTQSDRIESIQRKVTKFICYKLSKNHLSYEERLRYLKINSLKKRRIVQILKVLFKIRYKLFEYIIISGQMIWYSMRPQETVFFINYLSINLFVIKVFFINASNIFNSLHKNLRSESNYGKFVNCLEIIL
jgi:hypothetical protein